MLRYPCELPHNAAPDGNPKTPPGMSKIRFFQWRYTEDFGTRRVTRYRLSEPDARATSRDAVQIAHPLEIRTPMESTSDFVRSLPKA
jgi:hypothetical protein